MALEAIKKHSKVPAVVTFAIHREDKVREGWNAAQTCQRLEAACADVVSTYLSRRPKTMFRPLKQLRQGMALTATAIPVSYWLPPLTTLGHFATPSSSLSLPY